VAFNQSNVTIVLQNNADSKQVRKYYENDKAKPVAENIKT
jgi:hypothetical protein